jgi:hypothetical protein
MEINLNKGEVYIITDDYINKTSKEVMIQITDTLAIKYTLNKTDNNVKVTLVNTLLEDVEYSGDVSKDDFMKLIKGAKDLYTQLN